MEKVRVLRALSRPASLQSSPRGYPSSRESYRKSECRSPVLRTKANLLDFRAALARASRWQQTEIVLELLERVTTESQYYRSELQLVVRQLRQDLFSETQSLPPEVQRAVEASHVEAFLSRLTPLHCLVSVLLTLTQHLHLAADDAGDRYSAQAASYEKQLESKSAETQELHRQLQAAQQAEKAAQSHAETVVGQLQQVTAQLHQAEDSAVQLRQERAVLQQDLRAKIERLKEAEIEKEHITLQVEALHLEVKTAVAQADKKKQQCRSLEAHCQQLVAQTRNAAHRVEVLEQELAQAERQGVELRDRAAVAFDELTPRPDWVEAGLPARSPESHKSSKACLQDLLNSLHRKSPRQKPRHS